MSDLKNVISLIEIKFLTAMGINSSKLTTMEVSTLRYVMLKAIENESNLAVSDFMYNNDYLGIEVSK